MGKRSSFERIERDLYKTPETAVVPLLPHLEAATKFIEPCAGDGQLIRILEDFGHKCLHSSDIEPQVQGIIKLDGLLLHRLIPVRSTIITNPPWEKRKHKGEIFNRLLTAWLENTDSDIWLLFDADWVHTKQAVPYLRYCYKIVSVGRVKWFPDTDMMGKDNCAWYQFKPVRNESLPVFIGRI